MEPGIIMLGEEFFIDGWTDSCAGSTTSLALSYWRRSLIDGWMDCSVVM